MTKIFELKRRDLLKTAAIGTASLGLPAIIGRASVASAQTSFAGEGLITIFTWSGNYEQVFRSTIVGPFNAKYNTKVETVGSSSNVQPDQGGA